MPLAAKAQPITGLYIGAGGGVNIMQDEGAKAESAKAAIGGHLRPTIGPAVDLSVGYGLGNGFRAEVEGSYRYNTFNGSSGGTQGGGNEQKFGAMFNVLYDFVGMAPVVQPYVGVGAGYQWAQDRSLRLSQPGISATAPTDKVGEFAYQAILGAAFPIPNAPGLAVTADYRFMGLAGGDRKYNGTINAAPAGIKLDSDYNHTILVGIRYAFGAAPAPAPAAPPAAAVPPSPVSRSYLVFFDWDKADLTERAKQIVSEAAANSTKVQYTRLEVNGYTDTSGTPAYNQGLSVRRAQAVAAELVKDGVPKSAIAIQGFGETHLLVATGPGVREPQNRRVEIIIK
jgi:outer membrane protein OmpA-like peptidoglycan-associated protein